MNGAKHYMQKYGTADDASVPVMDLENDFPGLVYIEAKGLSSKGAPKNVYFETYAESDETRVHIPEKICRESTEIKMTFGFGGSDRRGVFDAFYDYVKHGKIKYWDSARKRMSMMVLDRTVEPSDDILKGNNPYILAEFTFRNLFGQTFPVCWEPEEEEEEPEEPGDGGEEGGEEQNQ